MPLLAYLCEPLEDPVHRSTREYPARTPRGLGLIRRYRVEPTKHPKARTPRVLRRVPVKCLDCLREYRKCRAVLNRVRLSPPVSTPGAPL